MALFTIQSEFRYDIVRKIFEGGMGVVYEAEQHGARNFVKRVAIKVIRQNYAIVAGLNTLALGLALPGGLISPEVTALISNGSAILASLNGIRPILRYQ